MNVIETADALKKEAEGLLKSEDLWRPFAQNGTIHVAGSTYLDLLVFPDLDVYFEASVLSQKLVSLF